MAPRKVLKISGEWATSLDFHVPWPMKGSMEGLVMDLLCMKKTSGGGGLQHLGVDFCLGGEYSQGEYKDV